MVITFDGDGTLWDFEKVMKYALEKVARIIREKYPHVSISVEEMMEDRDRVAREYSNLSLYEIRRRAFYTTLGRIGIKEDELAESLFSHYLKFRHKKIILFDDVMPVLKELKKSHKIGLITNGNTRFERHPIARFFDFAIQSEDVGFAKPDERIFRLAAQKAGTSRIIHVGDSIEEDYLGVKNAGFQAIWLNRKRLPKPDFVEMEIHNLFELLDFIRDFS